MKKNYTKHLDQNQINILKYTADPAEFITGVLGLECAPFHREWMDTIDKNKFVVLLAPRGHGKTTIIGSYITWRIIRDRSIKILIVTINQAKANNMMNFIQECLLHPKVVELFGDFKGNAEWSRTAIRVRDSSKKGVPEKEPTLEVIGQGTRIVSSHYNLIILDDVTDDESSKTEHRRVDLENWYEGPLIGTFKHDTKVINIGTRWHEDDFHNYLMHKEGYKILRYQALLNMETFDKNEEEAKVLWPEHLPWDDKMREEINEDLIADGHPERILPPGSLTLEFIRKQQGERHFMMQYQNTIVASGLSKFKPKWVDTAIKKYDKLAGVIPLNLKRFIGVDLGGDEAKSDYCAIVVLGTNKEGDVYLLDLVRTHAPLNRQVELMKAMDDKWNASRIGIDSAAQQKIITSSIMKENPNLPIHQVKPSRVNDRETRTDRLSILFETNRVFLNPLFDELVDELRVYPYGKHDDCIDAFSFALEASSKGGFIDYSRVADSVSAKTRYNIRKL